VHLVSPRSAGLFSGAIMQSGAFDNYTVQADPEASFQNFSGEAGCPGDSDAALACLRKMPVRAILGNALLPAIASTNTNGWFSVVVDNVDLSASPEVLAARGQINALDGVILGTNKNEGRLLMPFEMPVPGAPATTAAQFKDWLDGQGFYPAHVSAIIAKYPASDFNHSYWKAASQVFTDSQYTCPTQRSARWLIKSGRVSGNRVFAYQLRYEAPIYGIVGDILYWYEWCQSWSLCNNATKFPIGVGHAADVVLVWPSKFLSSHDRQVSRTMVNWWQDFAAHHNPNNSVPWPAYGHANETIVIQEQPQPLSGLREAVCNFWDGIHPVPYIKADSVNKLINSHVTVVV